MVCFSEDSVFHLGLEWDDEFDNNENNEFEDEQLYLPPDSNDIKHQELFQVKFIQAPPNNVKESNSHKGAESNKLNKFLSKSCPLIENALKSNLNIYVDYSGEYDSTFDITKTEDPISFIGSYINDISQNRTVTSVDWCPQSTEYFIASFNSDSPSLAEPDGVVLVWNSNMEAKALHKLHCHSPVLKSCYSKSHPSIIVGGTYSGQVVVWDCRVSKPTPVQMSVSATASHSYPVYCVHVYGDPQPNDLVTISTEGRMCIWSLDMLHHPQDTLLLQYGKQSRPIGVTCSSIKGSDPHAFILGSEEGAVFNASCHRNKSGVISNCGGHQGPISAAHSNLSDELNDLQLFITSSFDMSIKLWNENDFSELHSLESHGEYILDCAWSPTHPALFCSVDCGGYLDLWNINQDSEHPITSYKLGESLALNCAAWSTNGQQIIIGDDIGKVTMLAVNEHIFQPRGDEWGELRATLNGLNLFSFNQEEDSKWRIP